MKKKYYIPQTSMVLAATSTIVMATSTFADPTKESGGNTGKLSAPARSLYV